MTPPSPRRITPEVDGLLVPPNGDLAKALGRLCADQSLRQAWGHAARVKAVGQGWRRYLISWKGAIAT